jgi:hypothetical protein
MVLNIYLRLPGDSVIGMIVGSISIVRRLIPNAESIRICVLSVCADQIVLIVL